MTDAGLVMQTITDWAWIGWLVLIAVFLVIEMLTLDFTFLMLALGSAVGLLTALTGIPFWIQLIIAAAAAAVLILVLRPPLLRRLHRGEDPAKSNVDALLGMEGTVLLHVAELSGQVKLRNGDTWTARSGDGLPHAPGSIVIVESIEGATAVVRSPHR